MTNQPKLGAFIYKGLSPELRKKVEATWLKDARRTNMSPAIVLATVNKWREGKLKYLYVDLNEICDLNGQNGRLTR